MAVASKQHLARLNLRENELEDRGAVVVAKAIEKVGTRGLRKYCKGAHPNSWAWGRGRGLGKTASTNTCDELVP